MTPEELATLRPGHVVINDSGPTFHIIERRKDDDTGWWMTDGSGLADRVALGDPWWTVASFIVSLFRWKAEAKTVLSTWEAVWEEAGCPGRLGDSKAEAVLNLLGCRVCGATPRACASSRVKCCPDCDHRVL